MVLLKWSKLSDLSGRINWFPRMYRIQMIRTNNQANDFVLHVVIGVILGIHEFIINQIYMKLQQKYADSIIFEAVLAKLIGIALFSHILTKSSLYKIHYPNWCITDLQIVIFRCGNLIKDGNVMIK